jgi:hypothetical protein
MAELLGAKEFEGVAPAILAVYVLECAVESGRH